MKKEIVSNPVLWSPSDERVKSSQMYRFIKIINAKHNMNIKDFTDLHTWSIKNKADFWSTIWGVCGRERCYGSYCGQKSQ